VEPWQQWFAMAQESAQAAQIAEDAGLYRSTVSRYYYAAYQAVTAVLLYLGTQPPVEREAWSHEATPEMLRDHLPRVVPSRDTRKDLARRLAELYRGRVMADYTGDATSLVSTKVDTYRKSAKYILDTMEGILQ
jgi:uncharacterized protein (UPF0332 family)